MKPGDRPEVEAFQERVTELETLLTHQQRIISELNEVIIQQAQRLDELLLRIGQLDGKLDGLQDQLVEQRNLEDEKPPHY